MSKNLADFDNFSRKGLVSMARDYDKFSEGKLSEFVEEQGMEGVTYPLVQPFIIKMEKAEDVVSSAATTLSTKADEVVDKAKKLVNTFTSAVATVS